MTPHESFFTSEDFEKIAGTVLLFGAAFGTYYVGLILHELGHLACAGAIGWRPTHITIGHGKPLGTFRAGDLKIIFGPQVYKGSVRAFALERRHFRTKLLLFAAAGPMVTGLLAVFAWRLLKSGRFHEWPAWEVTIAIGVGMLLLQLLFTLIPGMVFLDGERVPNDGLQIWRAVSMDTMVADEKFAGHFAARLMWLHEQGKLADVEKEIERMAGTTTLKRSDFRLALLYWLINKEDVAAAFTQWELLLRKAGDERDRASDLDILATFPLLYGLPSLYPRAMTVIEEAIDLEPDRITLQGTKGSLLVELGQVEAGETLLRKVRAESASENDIAICSYYLALARSLSGDREAAEQQLANATEKYPTCSIAERISKAIDVKMVSAK